MSDNTRVICDIEGAANVIDGILFATVPGAGEALLHVSERISADKAARLCSISGFRVLEDEVKERDVEKALAGVRDSLTAAAAPTSNAEDSAVVEELRAANLGMAEDLRRIGAQNDDLRAQLSLVSPEGMAALQTRIEQLTADLATSQNVGQQLTEAVTAKDAAIEKLTAELASAQAALAAKKGS